MILVDPFQLRLSCDSINVLRSQGVGQQTVPFKHCLGWGVTLSYGTSALPHSEDLQILLILAALGKCSVQNPSVSFFENNLYHVQILYI